MVFTLGLNIVHCSITGYIVITLIVQLLLFLEFLVAFFSLILLAFLFIFFVQLKTLLKLFLETFFFWSSLPGYSCLYLFCKPPAPWSHWSTFFALFPHFCNSNLSLSSFTSFCCGGNSTKFLRNYMWDGTFLIPWMCENQHMQVWSMFTLE